MWTKKWNLQNGHVPNLNARCKSLFFVGRRKVRRDFIILSVNKRTRVGASLLCHVAGRD